MCGPSTEMEFLNCIFSRGFWAFLDINLSLLRLEFSTLIFPFFKMLYIRIFLFRGFFVCTSILIKKQSRVWFYLKGTVNSAIWVFCQIDVQEFHFLQPVHTGRRAILYASVDISILLSPRPPWDTLFLLFYITIRLHQCITAYSVSKCFSMKQLLLSALKIKLLQG